MEEPQAQIVFNSCNTSPHVAEGLRNGIFIHEQRIVIRGLESLNILVDTSGVAPLPTKEQSSTSTH